MRISGKTGLAAACLAVAFLPVGEARGQSGFGGNSQHTGNYGATAQNLNAIHWTTPIDLNNTGGFAHYGAPVLTPGNTIFVPVKTGATSGFEINAFNGATGALIYSLSTDYIAASSQWIVPYQPVLAINSNSVATRLYYPGVGGTVYYIDNVDSASHGVPVQQAFYTSLSGYQSNASGFNSTIFIDTPITADSSGNIFFGFRVQGTAPAPLNTAQSGYARIDPNGNGTYMLAATAAEDSQITFDTHNAGPAMSNDQSTVYVAVKSNNADSSYGYLLGLDATTLATKYKVFLNDPRGNNANPATLLDISTASPMVGPDGDVYYGIYGNPSNGSRGFLLHFSGDLMVEKAPGGFGWDYTPGVVPAGMVPSYTGTSTYLLVTKYNNYAGAGGDSADGVNRVALLDPNSTEVDAHASSNGMSIMREVLTVIGPTADVENRSASLPYAVREWCINTPGVDPATKSVFFPSEDGNIYRWNLVTNSLDQFVHLNPGLGEPYVPTIVGPDGTVFTLNGGTMSAAGSITGVGVALMSSMPDVRTVTTGQSLTFSVAVTNTGNSGNTPTGTLTLQDTVYAVSGGSLNGTTTTLASNLLLDGNGNASYTTSALTADRHFITASYSGDPNFSAGKSSLIQFVHASAATVTLTSSPNPSAPGQAITLTAAVAAAPPGSGTPTGQVTFQNGTTVIGQVPLNAGGIATLNTSSLSVGSNALTAVYASDTNFAAGTGSLAQTVQTSTATAVASSPNPSTFGQPVTFTSTTTSGAGTPVGTVTFTDGSTVLASNVAVNGSGQSSFSSAALAVGIHTITASFSGATGWGNSNGGAAPQLVNAAATTTTVISSPNPSSLGQPVLFISTANSSAGTPVGSVTFTEGSTVLASGVAVNGSGQASFSTAALALGSNTITATFTGGSGWPNSRGNAAPQVVGPAITSTMAASSPNPSSFGQVVTFTSTTTSGAGTPVGTVTFTEGSTVLASNVSVNGSGQASFSTSALASGSNTITATFTGSTGWANSSGNAAPQIVGTPSGWTTLANAPPASISNCMLLTDGGVMCQSGSSFYKLTPNLSGGYSNGTWSTLASLPSGYNPDAYASAILADGRAVIVGGEYNNGSFALSNMGAVYDPAANAWTMLAPPTTGSPNYFQCIGDAPATMLADGRFLIGSKLFQNLAVLNPSTLTWTIVSGTGKHDTFNSEEGWTLLPDGSVFTLDVENAPATERFLLTGLATGMWVSAGNTLQDLATPTDSGTLNAPGCPAYNPPGEMGPALLLPNGTVFAVGASGDTGIYTPPPAGSSATGSWAIGPAMPAGLNVEDGPAALLPNGHVLFGGSPGGSGAGLQYFEFDSNNPGSLIPVSAPGRASNDATYFTQLLVLPSGQVLFVDSSNTIQLYTESASTTYNFSWAPAIDSVSSPTLNSGATYQISGTQFNGLSQATAFGDESQNASNYPLVRITNNTTGHVFYAKTHGHSSMGVATGSTTVSTNFDVPSNIETGASTIQVVANGIPSAAVAVTIATSNATSTTVTSAPNPSTVGQAVTFTATTTSSAGTPVGTVTFTEGSTVLASNITVNSSGQASFSTTALATGTNTITATFTGGTGWGNSSGTAAPEVVNPAATTTTAISSPNPSTFGQSVTFTSTTTSSAGTPVGTVTFTEGFTVLASNITVNSSGQASFSTTALAAGSNTITAAFNGASGWANSGGNAAPQVVNGTATSTTAASSPNPSTFGQAVTFTSTTTSGAGTPAGTVTFTDGATVLASNVTVSSGKASFSTTMLAVGSHTITATFTGSTGWANSTGNAAPQIVNVNPAPCLVSNLGAAGAFSILGLADPQHSGNGAQVTVQSSIAGSATLGIGANGKLHLQNSATLSNAVYEDPSAQLQIDGGSSITGTQTKESFSAIQSAAVATSAAFASLTPTQTFSQQIQNTMTITGNGGQNVIAIDNQVSLQNGQNLVLSGGVSDTFIINVAAGQNFQLKNGSSIVLTGGVTASQVVFNFLGNGASVQIQGSSSGIFLDIEGQINIQGGTHNSAFISGNQIQISDNPTINSIPCTVVNNAATTTTVASSPKPSSFGQSVIFTSTTTSSAGTPVGTVTFSEGSTVLASNATVNGSGQASFSTSALALGSNTITATFTGATGWANSSGNAAPQVVNAAATITTVASSPNPSNVGQSVTFIATTTSNTGAPAGTVTFTEGSTVLASNVSVNGAGQASFSTTALAVGSNTITASFTGATGWANSSGNAAPQVVNAPATTTTAVTSTPNPSTFGQLVTFTSTITSSAGTPAGTVTFTEGSTVLASNVTVSSGKASFSTTALAVGSNTITATFTGASGWANSNGNAAPQGVSAAATVTTATSSPNPSFFGQSVTFTSTTTSSTGTPAGTVTFTEGSTVLASNITVNSAGQASFSTTALAAGGNTITATFTGSTGWANSSGNAAPQVVNAPAITATTVTSSPNPSTSGQSVTFTSTTTSGAGTPVGTVTFTEGSTVLASNVIVSAGSASFSTTALAVGSNTITATFTGAIGWANSGGTAPSQVVNMNTAPCLVSNLGAAGGFSILGLADPQHSGNGAQVTVQSPIAGSAILGVGANGKLHLQNSVTLNNAVYEDPSAQLQIDGGSSITGTQTKASFAAIQSAAVAAAAAFAALTPTQTFSQQIQNTTTITGNGGQNVIAINNQLSLNNGQNLILSGSSSDTFIFNVAQGQNFQIQNGAGIVLTGGVSATRVVFNFLGNGANVQIQSSNGGTANTSGIFLDIEGQINIQGGTHNSVFISGNQIQITGNPTINSIPCN